MGKRTLVLVLAVALLAGFAVAALAAESPSSRVIINGRMLTDIGWWSRSEELNTSGDDVGTAFVNVPGHSFLRARWRTSDATSGGMIELGLRSLQPTADVSLRYAYGWYRYGRCRILVGQTDNWFGSLAYHPKQYVGLNNNAHLLLFGWGFLWPHRVPQVQFTINTDTWGVQFALEEQRVKSDWYGSGAADPYFTFPRASLTGMLKMGGFSTHPGVSFAQHQLEGAVGPDDAYDTWAFVLPMMYSTGGLTLKFQGHYGANFAGEYPFYPAITGPSFSSDSGKLQDTFVLGGMLTAEYKVGAVTAIGGVGYESFSNDSWKRNGLSDDQVDRLAWFVAVPYQVNKFFGVHPEFSWYDYGDSLATGDDAGQEWMLGVQFRFIF
jgi:hypothetical protein